MVTAAMSLHAEKTGDSRARTFGFEGRLDREWRTVEAMIRCYCKGKHGLGNDLCSQCAELMAYAHLRLERCRFGQEKPTCAKCPVHCYQKTRREEIRAVMRYAGPRMAWRHPVLSLRHWLDGLACRHQTAAE
jgi:Nitrous oxide-stimulated promoter